MVLWIIQVLFFFSKFFRHCYRNFFFWIVRSWSVFQLCIFMVVMLSNRCYTFHISAQVFKDQSSFFIKKKKIFFFLLWLFTLGFYFSALLPFFFLFYFQSIFFHLFILQWFVKTFWQEEKRRKKQKNKGNKGVERKKVQKSFILFFVFFFLNFFFCFSIFWRNKHWKHTGTTVYVNFQIEMAREEFCQIFVLFSPIFSYSFSTVYFITIIIVIISKF